MDYIKEKLLQIEITIDKIHSQLIEEFFLKSGAYGNHELLYQENLTNNLNNNSTVLYFFFPANFPANAFLPMAQLILKIDFKYTIEEVQYQDYIKEFEKSFATFSLSKNMLLIPPWQLDDIKKTQQSNKKYIILRPGLAFGTGKHITSQLMTQYIENNVTEKDSVFDLGTGSGILALVCASCKSPKVLAIDIERLAIESAKDNLSLNQNQAIKPNINFDVGSFDYFDKHNIEYSYDIFIANILTAIFIKNKKYLKRYLDSSMKWALSGIPNHEKELFTNFLTNELGIAKNNFQIIEKDEWCIFFTNATVK